MGILSSIYFLQFPQTPNSRVSTFTIFAIFFQDFNSHVVRLAVQMTPSHLDLKISNRLHLYFADLTLDQAR